MSWIHLITTQRQDCHGNAMLKHTQVQLELIDDIDMYKMVEKGFRGGISVITHKHATTNPMCQATMQANHQTIKLF